MSEKHLFLLLLSYLCGAVPVGLITGKMAKGIDIRDYGSGNIGATNVYRTLGPGYGTLVFALDIIKGFIPVFWSYHMHHVTDASWMPVFVGLAAIIGHNCSPFLRFKGGKGVATSLGVAIGFSGLAGLIGFLVWISLVGITRYVSMASLIGVPICALCIWLFKDHGAPYATFGILATVFVFYKHRSNIKRLKAGTEPKVDDIRTAFSRLRSRKTHESDSGTGETTSGAG